MIASGLDTSREGGVTRGDQYPAVWDRQDFTIGCSDGVGRRAWGESVGIFHTHFILHPQCPALDVLFSK